VGQELVVDGRSQRLIARGVEERIEEAALALGRADVRLDRLPEGLLARLDALAKNLPEKPASRTISSMVARSKPLRAKI